MSWPSLTRKERQIAVVREPVSDKSWRPSNYDPKQTSAFRIDLRFLLQPPPSAASANSSSTFRPKASRFFTIPPPPPGVDQAVPAVVREEQFHARLGVV